MRSAPVRLRTMQLDYFKMQGTGNQILVVDNRAENCAPPSVDALRRLGNSATGPGFDSLMWITPARRDDALASYRVFNCDGSEVEQCGNGIRCVAQALASDLKAGQDSMLLDSPAGPVTARLVAPGQVAVNMGTPEFRPERVPFVAEKQQSAYDLDVAGEHYEVRVVSMGNPHCVLDVADVASAEVARLGPLIECHERFPARTNVGFMHIVNPGSIDLRVFERGVGETAACGTGSCAAMVVARQRGLVDEEVTVHLPGGQVVVSWRHAADSVWLTGNAELISQGTIDL